MIAANLTTNNFRPIVRYAAGATLMVAVAMGFNWTLSFLLPVLSLSFIAPGGKPPDIKGGLFFVGSCAVACFLGVTLAYSFLSMPPIHILITFILLFHIFYTRNPLFNPLVKVWFLIAILLIPNLAIQSFALAKIIAISLVVTAACTILLIWVIYLLAPENKMESQEAQKSDSKPKTEPTVKERFTTALTSTVVIMPVYLVFYFATIPNALLILVFVAILSMQPAFAKDWKVGKALIIGNTLGGLAAVLGYEILTMVPEYSYLIVLVLFGGLVFGKYVFSESPLAAVYGMAFSTFLLIICSVTGSDGDGGAVSKVWSRVIQIMIAVIYFVTAFGLIEKLKPSR